MNAVLPYEEIITIDNFLSREQCDWFIRLFHAENTDFAEPGERFGSELLSQHLEILHLDQIYFYKEVKYIAAEWARLVPIPNAFPDYMQVVRRAPGASLGSHIDFEDRVYSSIIYLNDDFSGGETTVGDRTIKPEIGKCIGFYGSHVQHELHEVRDNSRYILITWFRDLENLPLERKEIAAQRQKNTELASSLFN
jgi:hypothetical protein|tara:strand:- start:427 stop:1011 length:585 start_codon:yes stop_codon:yes gene_type:complete